MNRNFSKDWLYRTLGAEYLKIDNWNQYYRTNIFD